MQSRGFVCSDCVKCEKYDMKVSDQELVLFIDDQENKAINSEMCECVFIVVLFTVSTVSQ